jgi:hypothetical protein
MATPVKRRRRVSRRLRGMEMKIDAELVLQKGKPWYGGMMARVAR